LIYSDSLVRVWDGVAFDHERFLLVERINPSWCVLEFCDLALPEGERCFLTVPCQAYLLSRAAEGFACDFAHGDATCLFNPESELLRVEFRDKGYLIPNEWFIFPHELRQAVNYVG
jgi:hypothetical protein